MTEQSGASSPGPDAASGLSAFFNRADGGLLALAFSSLAFVAGLTKFADLGKIVDTKILVGGLCVSLFFAILCVYFTVFGMRATESAARDHPDVRFDDHLPVTIDPNRPGRWLVRFVVGMMIFLIPVFVVAGHAKFELLSQNIFAPNLKSSISNYATVYHQNCEKGPAANQRVIAIAVSSGKPMVDCEAVKSNYLKSSTQFVALNARVHNNVVIAAILIYLASPLVIWALARHGGFPRGPSLERQVMALQELRLMAAFASLGAFMLGIGLALVNASVAYVASGLSDPSPPPPPTTVAVTRIEEFDGRRPIVERRPIELTSGEAPSAPPGPGPTTTTTATGPSVVQVATPAPTVQITLPSTLTVALQNAGAHGPEAGNKITLEGAVTLRPPVQQTTGGGPPPEQTIKLEGLKGERGESVKGDKGEPGLSYVRRCKFLAFNCSWQPLPLPGPPESQKVALNSPR